MNNDHKLRLLEMVLNYASDDNWYTEDVIECYNQFYEMLNK